MIYCVDRFEGELAVLIGDDRSAVEVPRALLPRGIREGDYVRGEADLGFETAPEARAEAAARIAEKLRRLRDVSDK